MKKDIKMLLNELRKDANFTHNGVSGQDVLRKTMLTALNVEEGTQGTELYRAYKENQNKVFAIIDIIVDDTLPVLIGTEFDSLANYKSINAGETARFKNNNIELFRVSRIASGTQDLRRQNALPASYTVATDWYGAETYTEFEQFLTGQTDWKKFTETIARSFAVFIGQRIYDTIADSYDAIRATNKVNGAFDIDELLKLARAVKGQSGSNQAVVYGTTTALSKIARSLDLSDSMKDDLNRLGVVGTVMGMELRALPDAYRARTEEFVVSDDTLIVVPSNEKIVDVVLEGGAITEESQATEHNALQMEFKTLKKLGVQVRQSAVYGFYQIVD